MANANRNKVHPRNMKIFIQNINGWHGKKMALKYDIRKHNPDIILFAHTNIFGTTPPIFFYPYMVYHHNTQGRASGVAILVKPDIQHSLVDHNFQGDTLAIKVSTSMGQIVIGTNYLPPSRHRLPIADLQWFARHQSPAYFHCEASFAEANFPLFPLFPLFLLAG